MSPELLSQLVTSLLEKLDVEVEKVEVLPGARTVVMVQSPDSKRLIGPHGEHLRALNAVVRRLAEVTHPESQGFLIDVNGYHEAQLEEIRTNARTLAQRVRLFKHDVDLPPMSAYERLVIHELFANDPEIETVSNGEDKFRHIVLKHK
ncbi:MAG: spoII [Candidatus Adlerbacteria bacterium]|nr:spoII [Candidatus Adlerbacteria bacterium]